jgi:sulfite exporter TauE/SafE
VGGKGYLLGVLLGFIPCGLLYGALTAAASTGDPLAGAFGMGAFVLGTIPTLFAVALLGHFAGQRWRTLVQRGAPMLLLLNAGVLAWLAVNLVI